MSQGNDPLVILDEFAGFEYPQDDDPGIGEGELDDFEDEDSWDDDLTIDEDWDDDLFDISDARYDD
jgi:hypothetical protein